MPRDFELADESSAIRDESSIKQCGIHLLEGVWEADSGKQPAEVPAKPAADIKREDEPHPENKINAKPATGGVAHAETRGAADELLSAQPGAARAADVDAEVAVQRAAAAGRAAVDEPAPGGESQAAQDQPVQLPDRVRGGRVEPAGEQEPQGAGPGHVDAALARGLREIRVLPADPGGRGGRAPGPARLQRPPLLALQKDAS